jgi:hypothetical protein
MSLAALMEQPVLLTDFCGKTAGFAKQLDTVWQLGTKCVH